MKEDVSGFNTTEKVIIILIVLHLIAGAIELLFYT